MCSHGLPSTGDTWASAGRMALLKACVFCGSYPHHRKEESREGQSLVSAVDDGDCVAHEDK